LGDKRSSTAPGYQDIKILGDQVAGYQYTRISGESDKNNFIILMS
jgi:hypothetical protein